jgi:transcriptional regulator NrdR family protein
MSQYQCPECQGGSSVIETRAANGNLRRRRKCAQGHRFSTIEVAADVSAKIVQLVQWAVAHNINDDFEGYVQEILQGLPEAVPVFECEMSPLRLVTDNVSTQKDPETLGNRIQAA